MQRSEFDYDLPEELIAQAPPAERAAGRLLCLDGGTGAIRDRRVRELPELLRPGDLLVFNDTRVIPARLHGRKESGGRVEVMVERVLGPERLLVQVRASKPLREGQRLQLEGGMEAVAGARRDEFRELRVTGDVPAEELLERHGHVPLPPYIRRADTPDDRERYQSVFARVPGAVAAPTASLHFDEALVAVLERRGLEHAFVTLHVGVGTFQPVRVQDVERHRMHAERVEVGTALCERVRRTRDAGGRVVAIGTTVVRALESAAAHGALEPFTGETRLFIRPGFRFRVVDVMLTNFHLPQSTLLMLVSAFAGRDAVLRAYRHAVSERYRFFSYGDAMLVTPAGGVRETGKEGPDAV
ncbi:MAG TPA: tRNA preQ1(34) S-adenosylmethionine ribosyltransferase-isomerase QueA [Gammaproteobacteria bacterium]|nr:tRNA preQ1(34) S-adenosylmethionine ribosyltransferase-isomerase QueA [Gammaproteobacteria bacterium]